MQPLEIKRLSGGYNGHAVFSDSDLTLAEGDIVGVVGPNGGGKSTLFKTILGLIPRISGDIRIFGKPPEKGARDIGYVPQRGVFDLSFPITVKDIVLMGMRVKKGARPFYTDLQKSSAYAAMDIMGISHLENKRVGDISGGQLQRTLIARALAPRPKLLLLDEPTSNLDPVMADSVYGILRSINEEGVTILMISHDANISDHVERVVYMDKRISSDRKVSHCKDDTSSIEEGI